MYVYALHKYSLKHFSVVNELGNHALQIYHSLKHYWATDDKVVEKRTKSLCLAVPFHFIQFHTLLLNMHEPVKSARCRIWNYCIMKFWLHSMDLIDNL